MRPRRRRPVVDDDLDPAAEDDDHDGAAGHHHDDATGDYDVVDDGASRDLSHRASVTALPS